MILIGSLIYIFLRLSFSKECNVRDFGAKGDCTTLDTESINLAMNDSECEKIILDYGCFLSGSIQMQSHKTLKIEPEAVLKGAPQGGNYYEHPRFNPWSQYQDFGHSHWRNALIWGINVTNVRITGGGTIDGGNLHTGAPVPAGDGDKLIGIQTCSEVEVDHLYITNTGHFALLATNVQNLDLHDLYVRPIRDGFDIVSCQHVQVKNCDIQWGGDDALVFKSDFSLGRVIDTFDVRVKDCIVGTQGATGLEIGSETVGNFYDYRFSNCTITAAGDAGIGMAIMDGADVYDISYRNIFMYNITSPIQLYIGARGSHPSDVGRIAGSISNIHFENIVAHHCFDNFRGRNWTASFDGQPVDIEHGVLDVHPVGPGIVLKNVNLFPCSMGGGWPISSPPKFPEHLWDGWYKIGPRPSWGLFLRNVMGIEFRDLTLGYENVDDRPSVILQYASDVVFDHIKAERSVNLTYDIAISDGVYDLDIKNSPGIVTENV